jgi:hypothetical protein
MMRNQHYISKTFNLQIGKLSGSSLRQMMARLDGESSFGMAEPFCILQMYRSMEVQVTDFANAAFTVFIALLSRAILFFELNLYMPISLVDENMRIAHRRDSVRKEKFYFRKHASILVLWASC